MLFKNDQETFLALSRSPLIGIVYCYKFHLVLDILVFFSHTNKTVPYHCDLSCLRRPVI